MSVPFNLHRQQSHIKTCTQDRSREPKNEQNPRLHLPVSRRPSVHGRSRECCPAKHYLVAVAITNGMPRELSWDPGPDAMLLIRKGSVVENIVC